MAWSAVGLWNECNLKVFHWLRDRVLNGKFGFTLFWKRITVHVVFRPPPQGFNYL